MKSRQVRVLLIEDDEDDYILVKGLLSKVVSTKYHIEWVRTYEDALKAIDGDRHDVFLLDYYLGDHNGLELLREINRRGLSTPVIFLTGFGDYEMDVEAMHAGASDYLVKGQINGPLLERSIRYTITQKITEEKLRHAQKMEAIGTLAGGIAHDFNNILAGIIGFTEMVLEDTADGDPSRKKLELVMKSAFRGRDLVKQILAFSRKTEYKREPVSLSQMITETINLLRASFPAMIEIEVLIKVKADAVFASPSEIQQVIMNLCTNAAHAMRESGGTLTLSLDEREGVPVPGLTAGSYAEVTVSDTGTGMDPEVMARIFEPFFTTKKTGQGTGMGLAVVYGIIKAMEGDITVESTPGAGSAFHVFFPKLKTDAPPETKEASPVEGGKERILFIDDEEVIAELGKSMLEKLGYQVTAMTDSIEALKLFSHDPTQFDVVVTDQTMPRMTGLALARKIRKIRGDMPVILCTGHSDSVSREKAIAAGLREFLMKPLTKREITRAIRQVLDAAAEE
ncbi:MAG TPA: response regulator [Syntrophorhabdaceae bacterium]|jgi:signal transduction histidine kinase